MSGKKHAKPATLSGPMSFAAPSNPMVILWKTWIKALESKRNTSRMDAKNVIKHGDENFQKSIKNLPESAWTNGFVTGTWTLKDVLAHIASYELILVDVLKKTLDPKAETPHVEKRISLENNV